MTDEPDDEPSLEPLPSVEQAVIGACFLTQDAAALALLHLRPEHFTNHNAQAAFRAIQRHAPENGAPDVVFVLDDLKSDASLNGAAAWTYKALAVPTAANQGFYVARILRDWISREERAAAGELADASTSAGKARAHQRLEAAEAVRLKLTKPLGAIPALPSAEDFCVTVDGPEPPSPEMIVERFIVRDSLNIFFGPPASGKSWLMMALSYDAVTTGGSLLGSEELQIRLAGDGRTERTLWIYGTEDNAARILRRLKKLHAGGDRDLPLQKERFLYQTPPDGVLLNSPEGWTWLLALVTRYQPTIVVLDTIASLTASTLDVNKAEAVVPFMQRLLAIRAKHRLTFLLGHHTSKPSKDAGRGVQSKAASMLGSQAWLAMTEGCFMVDAKDGDTSDVTIRCVKTKDVENPIPPLRACLDRENGRFRMLEEDEEAPTRDVVTKAPPGKPGRKPKFTADLVLALRPRFPDGIGWNEAMVCDALQIGHATWLEHKDAVQTELINRGCCMILSSLKWGDAK